MIKYKINYQNDNSKRKNLIEGWGKAIKKTLS